jgi:muramidase (phage lysozyme)
MPDARVDTTGATTLLESCDPGSAANPPNDTNIRDSIALAAGRDTLTATIAGEHVSSAIAACASRLLVEQGDFRDALTHPSADVTVTRRQQLFRESVAAGSACRADSQAGLP